MAFVTPYSDPNAHGTVANSHTFRRNHGLVILQKKPVPKYTNTPGQVDNRALFATAVRNFQNMWPKAKKFLQDEAKEQNTTSAAININLALMNQYPQKQNFTMTSVVGSSFNSKYHVSNISGALLLWALKEDLSEWVYLGQHDFDNNVFLKESITPQNFVAVRGEYNFLSYRKCRRRLYFYYKDGETGITHTAIICFPQGRVEDEFWLSKDWSLWTINPPYNWFAYYV